MNDETRDQLSDASDALAIMHDNAEDARNHAVFIRVKTEAGNPTTCADDWELLREDIDSLLIAAVSILAAAKDLEDIRKEREASCEPTS